ncbi:chemocyanin-like [Pyrus ussuriensis x Pyrus communis]|uniref:Chemocyanin-like n=1 Tax=Pyrus ussuriensis x Pyrus communis TaxID=2448454 RepID=A0A5N5H1U4_9ROSA|nr:chemocyanin-like [Pyrus ussuriensis x Pyrus communis]
MQSGFAAQLDVGSTTVVGRTRSAAGAWSETAAVAGGGRAAAVVDGSTDQHAWMVMRVRGSCSECRRRR